MLSEKKFKLFLYTCILFSVYACTCIHQFSTTGKHDVIDNMKAHNIS